MKKTKLLLGSLVAACAFSACSVEEGIEVANPEATSARPQVNLVLSNPDVDTRMCVNADGKVVFTTNDELGAVLVDKGYSQNGWNSVDWTVINGHAANNKWVFDADQSAFITKGTTAVGAWLFYTPYNEAMTTSRNGVEFSFPQIQDGSVDKSKVANNNINFFISPIVNIDGMEGEKVDIPLNDAYASIYNYMNIKLAFSGKAAGVSEVEKILVRATDANGAVKFPSKSVVVNEQLAAAGAYAELSLIEDEDNPVFVGERYKTTPVVYNKEDQEIAVKEAYAAIANMMVKKYNDNNGTIKEYKKDWNHAAQYAGQFTKAAAGAKMYDYLVVDCGEHSNKLAVANGKFSTWMLMPAGVYKTIELEIYTDKGVFTKTINGNDFYKENMLVAGSTTVYQSASKSDIILSSQTENSIANIQKVTTVAAANDYLKVNGDPIKVAEGAEFTVSQTSDLVAFIEGIQEAGSYDVNIKLQDEIDVNGDDAIAAHSIVINQVVMDAIEAKEAQLKGDIQLVLKGLKLNVVGNATSSDRLDIHDLTFNEGCDVVSGYVTTSEDLSIPAQKTMTVKGGANVTFGTNFKEQEVRATMLVPTTIYAVVIEKNAKATVIGDLEVTKVTNSGTMAVNVDYTLSAEEFVNNAVLVVKGAVVADVFTATKDSETTNHGEMTVGSATASTFAGVVTNNNVINIVGVASNSGSILNNARAKFMIDGDVMDGNFTNTGEIVNYGKLVAQSFNTTVKNSINNQGTIEAKAGATTWITTNSKLDETSEGGATNDPTQVMGVVKVDERNADLTIAVSKQQGYKVYEVAAADIEAGVFSKKDGDVFNKIILSDAAELNTDLIGMVQYVETSKDLTLPAVDNATSPHYPVKELTFTASANFKTPSAYIWELNVNQGVSVKIPVGSTVSVKTMSDSWLGSYCRPALKYTKTNLAVHNYGEIWCGGKFKTDLSENTVTYQSTLVDDKGNVVAKGKFYGNSGYDSHAYDWGTK